MDPLRPSSLTTPRNFQSRAGHGVAANLQIQSTSINSIEEQAGEATRLDAHREHQWRLPPASPPSSAHSPDFRTMSPRPTSLLAGCTKPTSFASERISAPPPPPNREYPVAQVDPWPLNLVPTSAYRRFNPSKLTLDSVPDLNGVIPSQHSSFSLVDSASSPSRMTSPRKRQVQARHKARVIEESKLQPMLVQELHSFLLNELKQIEDGSDQDNAFSTEDRREPSQLRRLQVFRALFQRIIEAFSVYAPLLALIRDEYENVISLLRSRSEQLPRLRAQLQTLETQCLHEISMHSLEERARVLALKKQLKHTQGRLTACAATNASLREQIEGLQRELARLETRSDGLQRSNHTLVSSIKRHDETLQQVHQRSVDEGQALQQVTQRYYHACDEITELKKTIAHLEEKVDGVQVAADRATIALLTKELQDLHTAVNTASNFVSTDTISSNTTTLKTHIAINESFVRAFEGVGIHFTIPSLMELIGYDQCPAQPTLCEDAATTNGIAKMALVVHQKLLQLCQLQLSTLSYQANNDAKTSESVVFLTEPPELPTGTTSSLNASTAIEMLEVPGDGYLQCLGTGADVPEHLQFEGVVRNLHFSLGTTEQFMEKIWDLQDEITKARNKPGSISLGAPSHHSDARLTGSNHLHIPPLRAVLISFLHRTCSTKTEMAETVYNLVTSVSQFAAVSSDCHLFQLVLERQAPDEARIDREQETNTLHEALFVIDRERQSISSSDRGKDEVPLPPGCVSVADIVQTLRLLFPWKTDQALSQLYRSLLLELRGQRHVEYSTLLRQHHSYRHSNNTGGVKGISAKHPFVECLKSQYVEDIIAYRQHLQQQIKAVMAAGINDTPLNEENSNDNIAGAARMMSLKTLRQCLQSCDPAKPEQEIAPILSAVSGLTIEQTLTRDDMMVDGTHVIDCLPTLLIRPSGRFSKTAPSCEMINTENRN